MKKLAHSISRIALLTSVLCLLSSASCLSQTSRQVIFTGKAPKPIGPYSQAILSGNTLYVAGQIAIDPATGKMDTLDIETEVRRILSNLGEVLKAGGMSWENVVKATIYTTDLKNFKTINSVYGAMFAKDPPARETVQVAALPGKAHVEISCVAVK
ncbi:MAG TPA: Rid family detoxifying hydrolase [Bacteroidales bacterium]|nr:Rid family detoxifying hydrolase [Bacteroidales bacterium]